MAELKMTGKQATVGGISIATVVGFLALFSQMDNFTTDYSPHKAAFAAQQEVSELQQYIALQAEYNRMLQEQQQQWQAWQMQQAPPQQYYDPYYSQPAPRQRPRSRQYEQEPYYGDDYWPTRDCP
jgi:hypothetical protein